MSDDRFDRVERELLVMLYPSVQEYGIFIKSTSFRTGTLVSPRASSVQRGQGRAWLANHALPPSQRVQ